MIFFKILKVCIVTIRPLQMTSIGATITIYCDLNNEALSNLFWRRYNYNGSNILNLNPSNIPNRYDISSSTVNSSNSLSLLTITGIQSEDFATFECSSTSSAKVNLIEARNLKLLFFFYKLVNLKIEPFCCCYL